MGTCVSRLAALVLLLSWCGCSFGDEPLPADGRTGDGSMSASGLPAAPGAQAAADPADAAATPVGAEGTAPADGEQATGAGDPGGADDTSSDPGDTAGGDSGGDCGGDQGGGSPDPGSATTLTCQPRSPQACTECIGEKCCDLLELCAKDGDCACMAECVGAGGLGGVDACLGECDVTGSPPGFAALADCLAVACPDGDECSTPPGFAPPPDAAPAGATSGAGIGSGELTDCSFDTGLAFDGGGEVLQLESADGGVCVRLERRNDGSGSLANTQFTALEMRVGPTGEVASIEGATDLCYYSSHHNFNDWVHAWSGERHYDLELAQDGHGGARTYVLYVFEAGPLESGSCAPSADGHCRIGSPIELFPVDP